jgi:hypothetical protein
MVVLGVAEQLSVPSATAGFLADQAMRRELGRPECGRVAMDGIAYDHGWSYRVLATRRGCR